MSTDTATPDTEPSHTDAVEAVLQRLGTDPENGLSTEQARDRLEEYGENRIAKGKRTSAWTVLLGQFKSIVILILVAAGVLAAAFQEWPETIAVAVVVLVNTAIGFVSEWKALRTMEALQQLGETEARVRRGGEEKAVPTAELVPGDILLVVGGQLVPADARVVATDDLRVDESALTGESVPVAKAPDPVDDPETPLADRTPMVFKGTTVSDGTAVAVVVATGMATELGKIARQAQEAESMDTPLQQQLDGLGRRLAWITVALAAVVAVLGFLAGEETRKVIETSLALGVAAIPEGLPIVATIALARGMWLMAKRNAVVNRLTAVETLGATRIILTDKTGTLTQNKMTVARLVLADGEEVDLAAGGGDGEGDGVVRLLEVGVLCNNADLEE